MEPVASVRSTLPAGVKVAEGSMALHISIDNEDAVGRNYLTWAPIRGKVRQTNVAGLAGQPVTVLLSNDNPSSGGQLEFAASRDRERKPQLELVVAADGTPAEFWVAGVFGK